MKVLKINHWEEIPDGFTGKIIWSGNSQTYHENKRIHRVDGPAIIESSNRKEYWLNDERCFSKEKWLEELTNEQKVLALMNPENFDE